MVDTVKKSKEANKKFKFSESTKWFIFSLIWIVVWACLTWWITTIHENEMRNFSAEKDTYTNFLNEYYNHFNSKIILDNYKEKYEKYITSEDFEDVYTYFSDGFISSRTNDYYYNALHYYKDIINWSEDIKTCYFWIPSDDGDKEDLRWLIWETQRRALSAVMATQMADFRSKTFDAALIMPKEIYESSFNNLWAWIAPNPFNYCEWINNAICWVDFSYFMKNNEYTFTYWLNFMNEDVVEYLRSRMQKYY